LAAQTLVPLLQRYDIELEPHLVNNDDNDDAIWRTPNVLQAYARHDGSLIELNPFISDGDDPTRWDNPMKVSVDLPIDFWWPACSFNNHQKYLHNLRHKLEIQFMAAR
jgi:hypothetical protein